MYSGVNYHHLPPYLYQILIATYHNLLGLEWGVVLFRFTFLLTSLLLGLRILKNKNLSYNYYLILSCVYMLTFSHRSYPRPELGAFVLGLLLIYFIEKFREQKRTKFLITICLVQFVWVNFHVSSLLGYILVFTFYSEQVIFNFRKSRSLTKKLVIYGMLTVLIGFINPMLEHPFVTLFEFTDKWDLLIMEYQSFNLVNEFHILMFTLTVLALLLFVNTRRWYGVFFITLLFLKSMQMNKLFPFYVCFLTPILLLSVFESLNDKRRNFRFSFVHLNEKKIFYFIFFIIFSCEISYLYFSFIWEDSIWLRAKNKPEEALNYLINTENRQIKIFNRYSDGGYIIYRSPDSFKIYIDGRTNLLYSPDELLTSILSEDVAIVMKKEFDKHKFDYFVLGFQRSEPLDLALRTGVYNLEFAGMYSAVLTSQKKGFKKARIIFTQPQCIEENQLEDIEKEYNKAIAYHNSDDLLPRILKRTIGYLKADDKIKYLLDQDLINGFTIYDVRLLANLFSRHNLHQTAIFTYSFLSSKYLLPRDIIFCLNEMLKLEKSDFQHMKKLIEQVLLSFKMLQSREKAFIYKIIMKVKEKTGETYFTEEYVRKVFSKYLDKNKPYLEENIDDIFRYKCHEDSELVYQDK